MLFVWRCMRTRESYNQYNQNQLVPLNWNSFEHMRCSRSRPSSWQSCHCISLRSLFDFKLRFIYGRAVLVYWTVRVSHDTVHKNRLDSRSPDSRTRHWTGTNLWQHTHSVKVNTFQIMQIKWLNAKFAIKLHPDTIHVHQIPIQTMCGADWKIIHNPNLNAKCIDRRIVSQSIWLRR